MVVIFQRLTTKEMNCVKECLMKAALGVVIGYIVKGVCYDLFRFSETSARRIGIITGATSMLFIGHNSSDIEFVTSRVGHDSRVGVGVSMFI